ncbi:MAG: hypothetical protein M1354_03925 [Candidatus Marsarchaeota archaeon]|jgi:hypothetical protein|nr:hypothetical protein [Candidatus Marsarchaeota archaeon]
MVYTRSRVYANQLNGELNGAVRGTLRPHHQLNPEQERFVETLKFAVRLLDSQGFDRQSWMLIAGGAVFAYQLDCASKNGLNGVDRIPTDVDIVIMDVPGERHVLNRIKDAIPECDTSLRVEPVLHFGHILKGPALSIEPRVSGDGRLKIPEIPIDIITELSQEFPPDHKFAPACDYIYPETAVMLSHAKELHIQYVDGGGFMAAHPGFIAFYKLMLGRNSDGKQDTEDLKRLKRMQMLGQSPELSEVISIMCHNGKELKNAILREINDLQV